MTKIKLITEQDTLDDYIADAKNSEWLAVDTEFLREKTYYPLLCLIQCKTETEEFCIDVLAIEDLSPLQQLLRNQAVTKVIHSCRQDLEALDQRLSGTMMNLYDTQVAAAFCGYGDQVSYGALVESVCGVQLDKSHTRTDWSARPLSTAQLQYAIEDVSYLNDLREYMNVQLLKLGRVDWHREECDRILNLKDYKIDPELAWKRLKGGGKIPVQYQQCAKALSTWREFRAQKSDRPREWILSSQALKDICCQQPSNLSSLSEIKTVYPGVIRKSGEAILKILNTSAGKTEPVWNKIEPLDSEQRKRVKEIMNRLKSIAEDGEISQSILANRSDIEALVSGKRDIPVLEGWRYKFAGERLLAEFA
jgi:ribonuclease D